MTFLLVLLRLFSFSQDLFQRPSLVPLHCLHDFILFPTLTLAPALMACRSVSRLCLTCAPVWKPTGRLAISTSVFQRVLPTSCVQSLFWASSTPFQVYSCPCVPVLVNSTNHPAAWARNVGVCSWLSLLNPSQNPTDSISLMSLFFHLLYHCRRAESHCLLIGLLQYSPVFPDSSHGLLKSMHKLLPEWFS